MSLVPKAASDTMISPSVPEKSLEQDFNPYHQLQTDTTKLLKGGVEVEIPVDPTPATRTNSTRMCTHSGPCYSGEKKKIKKKKSGMGGAFPRDGEDEAPLKQIGRGMLTIITTPIAFAGMGIYAVGLIVEGTGTMLKGMGSLGRHVFVSPRPRRRHRPDSFEGDA